MEKKDVETFQDLITKNTYKLEPKNRNSYRVYSNRYTLAMAFGVLMSSFLFSWQYALAISIAMVLVLEYRYRKSFLPSLKIVADVKKETTISNQSLIVNTILYLLFGIILIIYMFTEHKDSLVAGIGYAIGVAAIGLSITYGLEIYKQKR